MSGSLIWLYRRSPPVYRRLRDTVVAAQATFRAQWAKALALMWGPLVTLSVVATGNHYVFDVAAGLFVSALAYTAVRFGSAPRARRPGEGSAPAGRQGGGRGVRQAIRILLLDDQSAVRAGIGAIVAGLEPRAMSAS